MKRIVVAFAFVFLLAATIVAWPRRAVAQTPQPTDISVVVSPVVLGPGNVLPWGWNGLFVQITNASSSPAKGEITARVSSWGERRSFVAEAPYNVPSGGTVTVRLPVDVVRYAEVFVLVTESARGEVGTARFSAAEASNVVLMDVASSSLRGAMNDMHVPIQSAPPSARGGGSGSTLLVVAPRTDAATGDPVLPDRAALYNLVDAVVIRSDVLSRLTGPELIALSGYVLGGGTLAIAISRPEDLRHPTLAAFAGGEISAISVSAETLRVVSFPRAFGTSERLPKPADTATDALAKLLSGYQGGNLHGSTFGASAPYGLGEVHVLAFDPTRPPATEDPWAQMRILEMMRRAYDRRLSVVFRPGDGDESHMLQQVRKELDPNESSRWAIAAAALLLIVYSIIAAPVNYALAAQKNKPLRALRRLPLFAGVMFLAIVVIGTAAKGTSGRSRRISLVEVGAGMTEGTVRRFRAFFSAQAKELTVRTTDPTSVLRTAIIAEPGNVEDKLLIDREGARLVNVNALPWQTLVLREDGMMSLGDGIAMLPKDGATLVHNRCGRTLRGAILKLPDGSLRYFDRIEDGEVVESGKGREIGSKTSDNSWKSALASTPRSGSMTIHPLRAHAIDPVLPDSEHPGLADAWRAVEQASGNDRDWLPDGIPTLVAQIEGGEGKSGDSGLRIESDRLLVRVVGYGGLP